MVDIDEQQCERNLIAHRLFPHRIDVIIERAPVVNSSQPVSTRHFSEQASFQIVSAICSFQRVAHGGADDIGEQQDQAVVNGLRSRQMQRNRARYVDCQHQ